MLTIDDVKNAISGTDYEFFGIRVDDGICYNVGDIANVSHQLWQDPVFDEDGELIYPYIEDGIYKGFYDGGELSGTCAIGFDADDDESIAKAIRQINIYFGDYVHILGGNYAEDGNDNDELIISNASVLGVCDK